MTLGKIVSIFSPHIILNLTYSMLGDHHSPYVKSVLIIMRKVYSPQFILLY